MKQFINILYKINFTLFIVTLCLMVTIYFGFLFEILFGTIQVLTSLLLLIVWKKISENFKKKIFLYWLFVLVYFSFWLLNWDFLNDWILYIVGIGIIPLSIAWYFIKVLELLKKEI